MSNIMTFEECAEYLDGLADALPEGIMRELNGGISLLSDERFSEENGSLSTLGMYFSNGPMGRYIELYYGSFVRLYGTYTPEKFKRELKRTLYHELTHHIESLAGDRTLEREDEICMAEFEAAEKGEPLDIDSVLFVSADGIDLPAAAEGLFRAECRKKGDDIKCACAVITDGDAPDISAAAKKAAVSAGALMDKVHPQRLTRELVFSFDAVFCMTEEEADDLADEFPRYDTHIFALGERDVKKPQTPFGWGRCISELAEGVNLLIDDLFSEE